MVRLVLVTTTLKFSPRLGSTPAIAGLRSKEAGAANNLRVTAPPALRGNDKVFSNNNDYTIAETIFMEKNL